MLYSWHVIPGINFSTFAEGKITSHTVQERIVALLRKGNTIFAFAATCPHQGARLCEGWLDIQGRIVCPLHKFRFDPANGRNTSGEGYKLRTYPVEIREDFIYIGLIA